MNRLMKLLWKWQARVKLSSNDLTLRYTGIYMLGEVGNHRQISEIIKGLNDPSQIIRNASAHSLKKIYRRNKNKSELLTIFEDQIKELFFQSTLLVVKLSLIEVMEVFQLEIREELLSDLISESEHDLQYAAVRSLTDTRDREILDTILNVSDTHDLVLRKAALETWYNGINTTDLDEILSYCTPRLHFLIRATYELQTDGNFLRKILSFSNLEDLPIAKAYPDAIIRYLTALINTWEFDPEAYRTLHAIVVPSYFTFDSDDQSESERPFIIL